MSDRIFRYRALPTCLLCLVPTAIAPNTAHCDSDTPHTTTTPPATYTSNGAIHLLSGRNVPASIPDARLKQIQVVARHGARSTFSHEFPHKVAWDMCAYPAEAVPVVVRGLDGGDRPVAKENARQVATKLEGGCHLGQLTSTGFQQAIELGSWLRAQYVDQRGLLPAELDRSTLSVRTTNIARTILTATGILTGLYPEAAVELPADHALGTVLGFDPDKAIEMRTAPDDKEWLHPNYKHCQRMQEMIQAGREAFVGDKELNATLMRLEPSSEAVSLGKRKQGLRQWQDLLPSLIAHELPLPPGVDSELAERVEKEGVKMMSSFLLGGEETKEGQVEALRLACGLLLQDILGVMEASAAGKHTPLMSLYSAHDTTILPLLLALGVVRKEWPPFASSIIFELWYSPSRNQHYVQMIYNGEQVEVEGCLKGLCSLSQFNQAVRPYIPLDWAESCTIGKR